MIEYKKYIDMLNQWLILKQEGKSIEGFLLQKGYHRIAIYGMGIYGRHLVRELQGTAIAIAYGIDQKKMISYDGIEMIQPAGNMPSVDSIVNTVIHDHTKIKKFLSQMTQAPVLSLEDIIFESYG